MKIEIDTERDSEREFRAAIRLLEGLLGQRREDAPSVLSATESASPAVQSGGLFTMFGAPAEQPGAHQPQPSQAEAAETPAERKRRLFREYELHESSSSVPDIEPYD